MRTPLIALSLLLPVTTPSLAQDHAKDEAAIRQRVTAYEAAVNRRDGAALAALFTPDADFAYFDSPFVVSRDSIGKRTGDALAKWPPSRRFTLETKRVRYLRPDVALVETVAHFSEGEMTTNRGSAVFVRDQGIWSWAALRVYPAEKAD
jgi:uncharacterized protein (TIGR02246 family)